MSDSRTAAQLPPATAEKAVIDSRSSTSGDDSPSSPSSGKLEAGLINDEEYRRREKALVWKIDKNIIPFLTCVRPAFGPEGLAARAAASRARSRADHLPRP